MADKEACGLSRAVELAKPGDTPPVGPKDPQGPMPTRQWSCMGRNFAVALLGIVFVVVSLSCSRNLMPAQQAGSSSGATVAAAADPADPADCQQLGGLETRFEALATKLSPSVVAVSASSQSFDADDLLRVEDMNPQKLDSLLDRTTRMVGTGLIVDADGYILTNEHVVADSQNVWVTTDNGKVYPALVVGTDPRADLAVLKIPGGHFQPVRFSTDPLKRGQWAIRCGFRNSIIRIEKARKVTKSVDISAYRS